MSYLSIPDALVAMRAGRMIILVDDDDREAEGDLVIAASFADADAINFMAAHGRGLICLSLSPEQCDRLSLPMMVPASANQSSFHTPFTVSIEAAQGIRTGISAHDRATTIAAAIAPDATPSSIVMPGHIFPLRAAGGGVLQRRGHTEGSLDLTTMAGLTPAAVICEIMNSDGTMARGDSLFDFARLHNLGIVRIADLVAQRISLGHGAVFQGKAKLPSSFGDLTIHGFQSPFTGEEIIAVVKPYHDNPLVRLHSQCLTGDVFGSYRCDCGSQLHKALAMIEAQGGVLLYLFQEGRGIGILNKIKAYALQEQGMDTVEANIHLGFPDDLRTYDFAAAVLHSMGIKSLRLLSNNPSKAASLQGFGFDDLSLEPLEIPPNAFNEKYYETKAKKMHHLFSWIKP